MREPIIFDRRPGFVTLIGAVIYVQAVLDLVIAAVAFLQRASVAFREASSHRRSVFLTAVRPHDSRDAQVAGGLLSPERAAAVPTRSGQTAMVTARHTDSLDADLALRPGRADAVTVLALWCARRAFFPLLMAGFTVAIVGFGNVETLGDQVGELTAVDAVIRSLLSPLGGIVIALAVRIGADWLALASAFQLTGWTREHGYSSGSRFSRWFRSWWDRVHLASAYRSLRRTAVVRENAYRRLGDGGRIFRIWEVAMTWSSVVLVVAFLVVGVAVQS